MNPRQERLGLTFAGLCALNGAFVPALAKLTTNMADSVFVATVTTLFAGICAAAVLAARGELGVLFRPSVGPRLLAVGALGTCVAFLLFFAGAQRSTAIETVICLQSEPVYSLFAAWLFLGHRPTTRRLMAAAVLIVGIVLAVGARGISTSLGAMMLLATPLCWQISHLIVLRGLIGVSPPVLTGARYIHGGILLLLYWAATNGFAIMPCGARLASALPLLAVQGVITSYGGTLAWYQAVTRLDLARTTAIVVPSIPLLSLAASFAILGEVPTVWQLAGLLLTASGVLAFVTAPHAGG